jgi:hypothetical protein
MNDAMSNTLVSRLRLLCLELKLSPNIVTNHMYHKRQGYYTCRRNKLQRMHCYILITEMQLSEIVHFTMKFAISLLYAKQKIISFLFSKLRCGSFPYWKMTYAY